LDGVPYSARTTSVVITEPALLCFMSVSSSVDSAEPAQIGSCGLHGTR
jgi:hypothetical protein